MSLIIILWEKISSHRYMENWCLIKNDHYKWKDISNIPTKKPGNMNKEYIKEIQTSFQHRNLSSVPRTANK